MNLTAITEESDVIVKHFIDSITIEKYIPTNSSIIDVGSGAGFPGIPIKIIRSDINIVLLDSLRKRIDFLDEVVKECSLNDIKTIHGRAEDIAHDTNYREKFDIVTARAVANLSTLSELCTPFIKVGGSFICMKADADEELKNAENAEKQLKLNLINKDVFLLPSTDIKRTILVFEKTSNTPAQFPRKAGTPAKKPL